MVAGQAAATADAATAIPLTIPMPPPPPTAATQASGGKVGAGSYDSANPFAILSPSITSDTDAAYNTSLAGSDSSFTPLTHIGSGYMARILEECMGSLSGQAMSALTSSIMAIIDSGASDHKWPYRGAFVEFTPLSGCYITIADQSSLPVTGRGTVQFRLAGRTIRLAGVLCIPTLIGPLFSIRRFRKIPGCGFFATNTQLCLAFPTFTVDIDDTNEVSLPYESAPSLTTFDFDEKSTLTRLPSSSLGNAFGVTTRSGVHTQ